MRFLLRPGRRRRAGALPGRELLPGRLRRPVALRAGVPLPRGGPLRGRGLQLQLLLPAAGDGGAAAVPGGQLLRQRDQHVVRRLRHPLPWGRALPRRPHVRGAGPRVLSGLVRRRLLLQRPGPAGARRLRASARDPAAQDDGGGPGQFLRGNHGGGAGVRAAEPRVGRDGADPLAPERGLGLGQAQRDRRRRPLPVPGPPAAAEAAPGRGIGGPLPCAGAAAVARGDGGGAGADCVAAGAEHRAAAAVAVPPPPGALPRPVDGGRGGPSRAVAVGRERQRGRAVVSGVQRGAADLEGAVIDGVSCFQLGYDVIVTLAVLNTGPVDPAAALSLELQQLEAPGQFAVLPLPPVWLEVRDPQLPRVAAAAPSVGAGAAGAIVMLGVTSCADLGRAWVALGAQLQIGDGFAVYGSEVLAVINLANWGLSCGQAGQLVVTAGSFLYGISEDLWFQYQTVCETTYAAAQQAGTADNFLVLLRIPFVDLPSNDELGSIEISVGQTLLSADYLLVMDPVGQGQAVAITQNNDLTSSLAGNVVLAVTVTNFAIVAANDDVLVHFGGTQTPVQRLISSDFQRTRLTLIVPPA